MKKLICLMMAIIMVMTMAACADETEKTYEEAVAAYNAGNYAEAFEKLTILGDYEDAAQLLATIGAEVTGATVETTTADGTVTTKEEYVFSHGNLVKEAITHADGTVIKNYYKYDFSNRCTSETLNQVGGGKVVINHLYDDNMKTRSIRTNVDKSKDTYEYICDENGNVVRHTLTFSDGTMDQATYGYNAQGLVTMITGSTSITTYEYDTFGNVVKEAVTENNEVVYSATYTYDYIFSVN